MAPIGCWMKFQPELQGLGTAIVQGRLELCYLRRRGEMITLGKTRQELKHVWVELKNCSPVVLLRVKIPYTVLLVAKV
jgi:hypothetical protein